MNFKTAYLAIVDALTGLEGLPHPDLTPRSPENVKQFPALFIGWDIVTNKGAGDLKWITAVNTRAVVSVYIYVAKLTGANAHISAELLDHVKTVDDAITALTTTAPDFRCSVMSATADYSIDTTWAATKIEIEVGAFD